MAGQVVVIGFVDTGTSTSLCCFDATADIKVVNIPVRPALYRSQLRAGIHHKLNDGTTRVFNTPGNGNLLLN